MEISPLCATFKNEILKPIKIEQDNKSYILTIKIEADEMTFNISDSNDKECLYYIRSMKLNEIKEMHKVFYVLNSFNDFYEYLKALEENKKLTIKKNDNNLSINFVVEFLFKQELIEIILFPGKINLDIIVKDILNEINILKEKQKQYGENEMKKDDIILEEKIKEILNKQIENLNININLLKEENIKLINDINILKEEIKEIKLLKKQNIDLIEKVKEIEILKQEILNMKKNKDNSIKGQISSSVIMKENEFNFINLAIKNRINKEIKSIKKIYQATIDGGEPRNFHKNCDNIPNTLTLIQSAGNRRFGGFTSLSWESSKYDIAKNDKYAFLFSLDKQIIYPIKLEGRDAIRCKEDWGPCFGRGKDIGIEGNPIKYKNLLNFESSYIYNNNQDGNPLSECIDYEPIYAKDVEVFQIIF